MIVPFTLNGSTVFIDANSGERLVNILRKRFNLTGTKESCGAGHCGSCTVLMNNKPVPSCIISVFQVRDAEIVTIEEFSKTADYQDIIQGFEQAGAIMCGYCNAGKIFIAQRILEKNMKPARDEIKEMFAGNLCRCTSIENIIAGVKLAGAIRRKRKNVR
ncbi:2Fe-2S iron-sulfur cluster binding domain-containing protein [Brucepastera parasyntrophica]|uniref:(2Fe-2S)-binding protein n=1 Tax=Brucepastera parasyntrophica TaxID=2880008 RepID=UPI00210A4AF4|nr:2Fe-2S iron-sulfur cluster-binding protein [Brucepastera parasyntrophica]ULQ60095.1 2Fe-2S iron-sulfur cluster binding domain-containing protein [Brucepastera parasyntrophica]